MPMQEENRACRNMRMLVVRRRVIFLLVPHRVCGSREYLNSSYISLLNDGNIHRCAVCPHLVETNIKRFPCHTWAINRKTHSRGRPKALLNFFMLWNANIAHRTPPLKNLSITHAKTISQAGTSWTCVQLTKTNLHLDISTLDPCWSGSRETATGSKPHL